MGQVFNPPEGIDFPNWSDIDPKNGTTIEAYRDATKKTIERLQEYARQFGKGPEAGKIIKFTVGDGEAQYVVFSLKPVHLIYMPINGDYNYPYAHRLTASDIRKKIQLSEAIGNLLRK